MSPNDTAPGAGDAFSSYLNAYLQGREGARQRRQRAVLGILERPGADPAPQQAVHIPAHELIGRLPSVVQRTAARHADILSAFAKGLSHYPYKERLSMLRHASPYLSRLGFRPDELAGFDPTDRNLAEVRWAASHLLQGASPDVAEAVATVGRRSETGDTEFADSGPPF